jgi:uncharacterized Fe-S cluster protein YjdI
MSQRLQGYEAREIVVTFTPTPWIRSGVCGGGFPAVFDVGPKRWVRPERAARETVAAEVMRSAPVSVARSAGRDRRARSLRAACRTLSGALVLRFRHR